ncbi:isopenicillin N synthase family dioxygenase [Naasia lichenicola]|uniref:Isopenicillin N synthase family oxygenase n=1 Tax=Naasia lichenicola TaxID=2565933 RepID=A0A4S4FEK6_9MICO|nr:2-oxoglutarate and iron-dependent oxygenase domain-containing protein [Naasia lichenicola]THG28580.1 isopenicillin N synthase family oxygenase [Naasia lichenicola]
MAFHVPQIDISPYVNDGSAEEKAAVAAAVDTACREVGFIQIVGHGIPTDVSAGLASAMDDFFGMDLDAKKQYRTPPSVNRGYAPPKTESLSLSLGVESASRMNDFFEAFNIGDSAGMHPDLDLPKDAYTENVWPDSVPTFEPKVSTYYEQARRVAQTMVDIFEDALGVEEGTLSGLTGHSIDVMRMNNYALPPGEIELDGDLTGMGEHTDYGIVTVLWADQVKGLQVLGTDGGWHDVAPIDGALLINLGDVTARLTNEKWMSTLHRVKPPIVDGTIERRRSAAFFHDGDYDAVVAPLAVCIDEGEHAIYEPITVGEHIAQKLAGSRAGKKNTTAVREAARVGAASS